MTLTFCTFCGTSRAIECVVPGRGNRPPALPAASLSVSGWREQRGTQTSVQGKDGGAEPFADQGVGDALRADAFRAVVQE